MTPPSQDAGHLREQIIDLEDRLVARISSLEGQNRALRRLSSVLGVLVGLGLIVGLVHVLSPTTLDFLRPTMGVIEANGFAVLDDDGVERGRWTVEEDGRVRFSLHDLSQTRRMSISVQQGGSPGLSLANRDGQTRVALGLNSDGSANFVVADRAGLPRAVLGLSAEEAAGLTIVDAAGVSRVELGVNRDGVATVLIPGQESDETGESGNDGGDGT